MNIIIANKLRETEAEGPGKRFAIWVQGCSIRCKGCCNPEMLSFKGGTIISIDELLKEIKESKNIEGISILGGEPFSQAVGCAKLASEVKELGLSVVIFTGYTLEYLRESDVIGVRELIDSSDLIIDGSYELDKPDKMRRFVGSTNQRMHFLSNRYNETDSIFYKSRTIEIRYSKNKVTVNGWPKWK